jgi:hypothetical protein
MDTAEEIDPAQEAFTIGRALFAVRPSGAEAWETTRRAEARILESGLEVRGKYQRVLRGYVYVGPGYEGRYWRDLPAGTSPDDVIELGSGAGERPLAGRLSALGARLKAAASTPRERALVDAIAQMCAATEPHAPEAIFAGVKRRGMAVVLAAPDEAKLKEVFEALGGLALELQARPAGDGLVVASLLLAKELPLAAAARAGEGPARKVELARSLGYLCAPSPAPIEAVVHGLVCRLIRGGDAKVVRAVAEELKGRGDDHLDGALASPPDDSFYVSLYRAAAYELAAWIAGTAGAEAEADPAAQRRWASFALNAEERVVRVGVSLLTAVDNLDGSVLGHYRAEMRAIRAAKGEAAAALRAEDLVENQLLYPRSALPMLLGAPAPTPQE